MPVGTKRYQNLLSDAFPAMSLNLVRFLKKKNGRSKLIPTWRVKQVQNFVTALNATAFELERARREGRAGGWPGRKMEE
jgi:hypothetical protein